MNTKKIICLLLAVMLLLIGCTEKAPTLATEPSEATAPPPSSAEAQIQLIFSQLSSWKASAEEETAEPYYYAVTDLDRNGRLEIIAACTQGTGFYTYGKVFEVSEDFASLQECDTPCTHDQDLPEIIMDSVPASFDRDSGCYDYLFTNDTRNGAAEHYQSIVAMRLQNGVLTCTTLANSVDLWIDEGQEEHSYAIPSGDGFQEVSASQYSSVISEYQSERDGFTASFEWFTFDKEVTESTLTSSWNMFHSAWNE